MNYLLIVDDNPLDRELARGLLARSGLTAFEFAANGLEALEHLETSRPVAILTDLQVPEMDGLALVRAVRHPVSLSRLRSVPSGSRPTRNDNPCR